MTAILSWIHGDMVEGENGFSWAVLWPPHMRMVHVHPNTCASTINEWYIIIIQIKILGIKSNWDLDLPQGFRGDSEGTGVRDSVQACSHAESEAHGSMAFPVT